MVPSDYRVVEARGDSQLATLVGPNPGGNADTALFQKKRGQKKERGPRNSNQRIGIRVSHHISTTSALCFCISTLRTRSTLQLELSRLFKLAKFQPDLS